ncbi:endonuclease domain-containing protein [Sphingomonas sp.]|uniref:endonuclease domain-containing protein n=1 Tax=Sphingomonas sp. TaxID=28214 RepID=UPI003D6C7A46
MQRTPPELKSNARTLRNNATEVERKLWHLLGDHRPRFTRQLIVSHYIVDIACRSAKVAIELDGSHHAEQVALDNQRTVYLEAQGWQVLRFWNNDVLANPDGVVGVILAAVVARASTHPRPGEVRHSGRDCSQQSLNHAGGMVYPNDGLHSEREESGVEAP